MYQAHGLGGGADLPIPASFAILGGAAALIVSFVVLLLAWRRPRYDDRSGGRRVAPVVGRVLDGPELAMVARAAGMLLFVFTAWAALAGPDLVINPTFGIVYVWLWVGLVPASLVLGRFYRAVSPVRTISLLISRVLGSAPETGIRELSPRVGYWPAAGGLLAFVWLELVWPGAAYLTSVNAWFAGYLIVMIVGGQVYGDRWFSRADPFEVYSTLVAHLSVWGRDRSGFLTVMSPLRNLARIRPEPGIVAVVAVLLGSTAWDSVRESATWLRFTQTWPDIITPVNTAMLASTILVVGITFSLAAMFTPVGDGAVRRGELPSRLAHSIVPIVVGYMVAHYLTFFVEVGQATLAQVSDPMVVGADLFGTADLQVSYWWSLNPDILASTKVLAIVLGHVVGVVAAHDRCLRMLPLRSVVAGQLPLLGTMVLYTLGGLYLLFGS